MKPLIKQLIIFAVIAVVFGIGVYTVVAVNNRGNAPVAYWKFDEGAGSTAYDSAGANDGTIINAQWRNEPDCKIGKCLYFDGDGDYVDAGSADALDNPGYLTMSAWVKANSFTDNGRIISKPYQNGAWTSPYSQYELHTQNDGDVQVNLNIGGTVYIVRDETTSKARMQTGRWYYLVFTWDGTTPKLYIDGVLKLNSFESGSPTGTVQNYDTNLWIGWRTGATSGTDDWHGLIDEVRIYNYARTAAQIKADYLSGASRGSSVSLQPSASSLQQSQGLVGYWKMDESSGNAADSSGVGTTLTNSGTATFVAGKYGKATDLESTNSQYFYAADNATLSITSDLTISAWLKPESNTADTFFDIVGKWDGANESYLLAQFGDEIRLYIDSSSNYKTTDAANLATGTWYFISAVYNARDGTIQLYVNGEEKAGTISGAIPTSIADDAGRFHIGAEDSSSTAANFYDGIIDDVKIYNTARSAAQIMMDYETGPPPVAHWKMDEKVSGNGYTISDSSGSNHGTTNNGANKTGMNCSKPGKYGSACQFDGVDDYVGVPDHASLDIAGAITIEAWVKTNSLSAYQGIVAKTGSIWSDVTFSTRIINPGYYSFITSSDGSVIDPMDDYVAVPDTNWHHLAFRFDGTTKKIFLDGIEKGTKNWSGPIYTNNQNVSIGAYAWGNGLNYLLNGFIDDVRIYNYARTQKQIIEDMNAGHPAVGSPVGSYVAYWDFNEMQGTTAYDKSNNNNHGTITGADWTMNGKFGGALDFEADNNDYVTVTDSVKENFRFGNADSFTASAWIKLESSDTYMPFIVKRNTTGWVMQTTGTGYDYVSFFTDHTTEGNKNCTGSILVADGNWHHAVGVYDGVSKIKRVYVDGKFDTSCDISAYSDFKPEAGLNLLIGRFGDTADFDGTIDEVKIYPFALSPAEIKQEYNQGKAMVLGSSGETPAGLTGQAAEFCVPGDTSTCNPPVAWWKMDEKTGQYAYDVSDNENTGTLGTGATPDTSDPTWKSAGECHQGSCLEFDGTDDYVSSNFVEAYAEGTFSAWVRPATSAPYTKRGYIIWIGSGVHWYYETIHFFIADNNKLTLYFGDDTSLSSPALNWSAGVWHHVVATWDTGSNVSRIYIDGKEVATGTTVLYTKNKDITMIGNRADSRDEAYNGLIDDVRIYNYARTPAQIAWDYNRGKPKLHWKFDENTGDTAYDYYKTKNGDLTGHAPDWTGAADQCKFNYCLDFTPANTDYVDVGNTGIGANLYSVSFWIYPDSATSQNIIDFDGGTHKITTDASGNLTANGWSSPTYYKNGVATTSPTLCLGSTPGCGWQHIMITTATAFAPSDVDFGRVSTNYFDGKLDEIKFYTYPLTAVQVKMDYQGGAVRIGPAEGLP